MRPPRHADAAPLRQNSGVMPLGFGQCANLVGEGQRRGEVGDLENPLQTPDPVTLDNSPVGNLLVQLRQLRTRKHRLTGAARGAVFLRQCLHRRSLPQLLWFVWLSISTLRV